MIDFSNVKEIEISEGKVKNIVVNGITIWEQSTQAITTYTVQFTYNSNIIYQTTGQGIVGETKTLSKAAAVKMLPASIDGKQYVVYTPSKITITLSANPSDNLMEFTLKAKGA